MKKVMLPLHHTGVTLPWRESNPRLLRERQIFEVSHYTIALTKKKNQAVFFAGPPPFFFFSKKHEKLLTIFFIFDFLIDLKESGILRGEIKLADVVKVTGAEEKELVQLFPHAFKIYTPLRYTPILFLLFSDLFIF